MEKNQKKKFPSSGSFKRLCQFQIVQTEQVYKIDTRMKRLSEEKKSKRISTKTERKWMENAIVISMHGHESECANVRDSNIHVNL